MRGWGSQSSTNFVMRSHVKPPFGNAAREIGEFSLDQPNAQKQMMHVEGKYVVLWRHVGHNWKLDTDIWNTNQ